MSLLIFLPLPRLEICKIAHLHRFSENTHRFLSNDLFWCSRKGQIQTSHMKITENAQLHSRCRKVDVSSKRLSSNYSKTANCKAILRIFGCDETQNLVINFLRRIKKKFCCFSWRIRLYDKRKNVRNIFVFPYAIPE